MPTTTNTIDANIVLTEPGAKGKELTTPSLRRFRLYAHDIRPRGGQQVTRAEGRVWLSDAFLPVRYSDDTDGRVFWRALGFSLDEFERRRRDGVLRFSTDDIDRRGGRVATILRPGTFFAANSEEEARKVRAMQRKGDERRVYVLADEEFQHKAYASDPETARAHALMLMPDEEQELPDTEALLPPSPTQGGRLALAQYTTSEHEMFAKNDLPAIERGTPPDEIFRMAYANLGWPSSRRTCAKCGDPIVLVSRRWRQAEAGTVIADADRRLYEARVRVWVAACSSYRGRFGALRAFRSRGAFPDWRRGHDLAVAGREVHFGPRHYMDD